MLHRYGTRHNNVGFLAHIY